jgi:hypothetical protein
MCYNIANLIATAPGDSSAALTSDFVMTDKTDVKYFEDPILTFDNSIVYGCSMDLNF